MDILVGVCYRPPNQDEKMEEAFCVQLAEAVQLAALILMGHFNLPDMYWKYKTVQKKQFRRFLECVKDNFLLQLIKESTRGGASLDLLFC